MSRAGSIRALSDNVSTERSFEVVFWGYSRRDVDQYVIHLESQLATLVAERQEVQAQVRTLTGQLTAVQMELIELRRQPGAGDKATFRHLGPRVEHILAEAEAQAEQIRAQAIADIAADRARTAELVAQAREAKERGAQDLEVLLSQRRAEEAREAARRMEAATAEVTKAQEYAQRLRAEADAVLGAAVSEAQRVNDTALAEVEHIRLEGLRQIESRHAKEEEEAAALSATAELYAQQTRAAAEQHAQETRAAAEQHAAQTRAAAEQAATQLRVQAEQHATQVRAGAEQHAARLLAAARQEATATHHGEPTTPPEAGGAQEESAVPVERRSSQARTTRFAIDSSAALPQVRGS
jgi:cell division septum initiation protein DivIVA